MAAPTRRFRRVVVSLPLGLLALAASGSVVPQAARADDPGFTVSVTPTRVADGQRVIIGIKAAPGFSVLGAEVKQCRGGVDYQSGPEGESAPPADFTDQNQGNCPIKALSTSTGSDNYVSANFTDGAAETESFGYRVGAGTIRWGPPGGESTLTCDAENACAVVVEARVRAAGGRPHWQPFVQPLTFVSDDPFAGCGGPASGILTTAGPDRVTDTWVGWTVAECHGEGRTGAATRVSLGDEKEQVERFADGELDLVYSAGGYDDEMGLAPAEDRRPGIAVPVALNAAVLAVGGGRIVAGRTAPFTSIDLTVDEMAAMMTGLALDSGSFPQLPAIVARNAELDPARGGAPFYTLDPKLKIGALATAQASTWYQTRYFHELAPDVWKVPDRPQFNANRGRVRGVDLALGLADPPFDDNVMSLFAGRPSLTKVLVEAGSVGGAWVFTDAATAKAMALVPVRVQDADRSEGVFVAPTPETMAAAVPTMRRDGQGVLISDPRAVPAAGQPPLYPLTFVEYALVPAEPLLTADCKLREGSQKLLEDWLEFITGPTGQAALPPGMAPLTDSLGNEAAAAIARVGASEVTGNCAGRVQSPSPVATTTPSTVPTTTTTSVADAAGTTVPAPPSAAPAGSGSTGSRGPAGASGATSAANGSTPSPAPFPATSNVAAPATPVVKADVPPFAGKASTAFLGAVVSIVGIMALSSLFAVPSLSGWLPWRRPQGPAGYRLPGPE